MIMAEPYTLFCYFISAVSFTTFLAIFLLSPWISNSVFSSYKHLSIKNQVDWNTRIGSNIHAVIATTISVYAFLFDQALANDNFRTDALFVRSGISITFGYILADLVVILWYYEYFRDLFTVVHHLMALWAYFYVVNFGYLLFFANIRQIAELSTPFVNQRWFYDVTGCPRNSRCFITNGLLMVFSFFLGRIIFIPYFFYKTISVWSYPHRIALGPRLSCIWVLTSGTLDVINVYWFKKMVKGGAKLLMNRNKEKKRE